MLNHSTLSIVIDNQPLFTLRLAEEEQTAFSARVKHNALSFRQAGIETLTLAYGFREGFYKPERTWSPTPPGERLKASFNKFGEFDVFAYEDIMAPLKKDVEAQIGKPLTMNEITGLFVPSGARVDEAVIFKTADNPFEGKLFEGYLRKKQPLRAIVQGLNGLGCGLHLIHGLAIRNIETFVILGGLASLYHKDEYTSSPYWFEERVMQKLGPEKVRVHFVTPEEAIKYCTCTRSPQKTPATAPTGLLGKLGFSS